MDDRTFNRLAAEHEARLMDAGQDHYREISSLDRENSKEMRRPAEETSTAVKEKKPTGGIEDSNLTTGASMDVRRMSAQEAVERILLAYKDKDYFRYASSC